MVGGTGRTEGRKSCGQDVMDERINKRIYKARSLIIQTTPNFCLALIMRTKNEERSISICINSNQCMSTHYLQICVSINFSHSSVYHTVL